MPNVPLSGHWLTANYVKGHTQEEIRRFVSVYDRAVDFIRADPEGAKLIYPKYTPIREDLLPQISLNIWRKSEEINPSEIQSYSLSDK